MRSDRQLLNFNVLYFVELWFLTTESKRAPRPRTGPRVESARRIMMFAS